MWGGMLCALLGVLIATAAFMAATSMDLLPPSAENASTEARIALGLILFGAALVTLGVRNAWRAADEG